MHGIFNKLYAMHESFWHFEPSVNEIHNNWLKDHEMNDRDFIFTSLAFMNAIWWIDHFIGMIGAKSLQYNFEDIIKKSISKKMYSDEIIKWEEGFEVIFKTLGIYNKKTFNHKIKNENGWKSILKGIRNKLVHPNNTDDKVIHISGNFNFNGDGKNLEWFEFKNSFANDVNFKVKKDIFIRALFEIQNKCLENYESWNKCIDILAIKKSKINIPHENLIRKKINEHVYGSHIYDPILSDRWDMVNLYKAGEVLNNSKIMNYAVNCIKMSKLFESVYNYDFSMSNYAVNSFSQYKNKYIKEKYEGSSIGYAIEKIGYWDDWDAKNWFPNVFKAIDRDLPGEAPYPTRILAFSISKLDWNEILRNQEADLDKWKKMTPEDLALYKFNSI